MLSLNVTVQGDKVVIAGLQGMGSVIDRSMVRGMVRIAKGVHRAAYDWLSGSGGIFKTSASGKSSRKIGNTASGGYPVPVRTGHLRRLLDWLKPGESKGGVTAGPNEVIVYDSAEYARTIHEGTGSSAKFGPRRYLIDGFNRFNQGARAKAILEEELQIEIAKGR